MMNWTRSLYGSGLEDNKIYHKFVLIKNDIPKMPCDACEKLILKNGNPYCMDCLNITYQNNSDSLNFLYGLLIDLLKIISYNVNNKIETLELYKSGFYSVMNDQKYWLDRIKYSYEFNKLKNPHISGSFLDHLVRYFYDPGQSRLIGR